MKKNRFFIVGILAVLLIFGMVLAGCDNGTTSGEDERITSDPPKSSLYIGGATTPTSEAGTMLDSNLEWLEDNAVDGTTYTIKLSASGSIGNIELKSERLHSTTNVSITLTTEDAAEVIIALNANGRMFTVGDGSGGDYVTLTLAGSITLRGLSSNTAELVRVNKDATLELTENAKITGNNSGGVLVENGGTIAMSGGTISGNNGGGVAVHGSSGTSFTMTGGTISGNTSTEDGGGVMILWSSTFTMSGGTISGNRASDGGGVKVTSGATFVMKGTAAISGNNGNNGGGVKVSDGATFAMSGTAVISGNTARGEKGGGVYIVEQATFTMSGGTISGNNTDNTYGGSGGGGVCVENHDTSFTMSGGIISGNTAERGGGVIVRDDAKFTISDTAAIRGNTAHEGGGVKVECATFIKSGGTISGSNASTEFKNIAASDDDGHAVQLDNGGKKRNTTANSTVKLYAKYATGAWTYNDTFGDGVGDDTETAWE